MDEDYNDLLLRCARQDVQAFQRLYEGVSPRVYSLLIRILHQESLAEEILQEAFLKVWNSAGTFAPEKGKAVTWITTIARHKALDKLRALKVRPQETEVVYEGMEFVSEEIDPETSLDVSTDLQALEKCLEGLKQEQRVCVLQSYYYGYTHQELAEKMNKPLGTVKAWIRRGLDYLRDCMQ